MATLEQQKKFIEEFAPFARYAYKVLGKVKPSVCIGMACIESGYGTSKLMYNHHAVLGQKVGTGRTATKYWSRKFFTSKTSEEYTVGVHTVITDAFRSYDNLQQCALNYYELLNTKLYSKVKANADAFTQMEQIKLCKYMTSSEEVNSVKQVITKFNLTQYDTDEPCVPIEVLEEAKAEEKCDIYKIGKTYKLNYNMYVRKTPSGEPVKKEELTANAKLHAKFDNSGNAILKQGTKVTCKDCINNNGSIWIQIPSGFVCAKSSSGTIYIS